jgi:hypothetical protein
MRPGLQGFHLLCTALGFLTLARLSAGTAQAAVLLQAAPTVSVPEFATVRTGPGTVYDRVVSLGAGATAPAIGRSESGEWIQITFSDAPGGQGWVYAPAVQLDPAALDALPVVAPPPTATLPPTPAGQPGLYTPTPAATRLPTFTPAPELTRPRLPDPPSQAGGFPSMLLIAALFAVGIFGGVMAYIRRDKR